MCTIYDKLKEYSNSDYYGFHMPGHKRNQNMPGYTDAYLTDISEIEGFDDLHHAQGILKDAQERAARIYRAQETHFLINGSTVGILSAIGGVTKKGDTVLVARNCHKSVYHAIFMYELNPVYLYPTFDSYRQLNTEVSAEDVRDALEKYPQIRAVIIVSPTYDGVVSDVEAIALAVHEKGIPFIVDEAHGAHFGFYPYFPENANTKGADIVIHSLHKTLPALTQTALLHMNGNLVNRERVREYLHMLQSSSPSYVLMASIDSCMNLLENHRLELFQPYAAMLQKTREELRRLKYLSLTETERFDKSKLIISVKNAGMSGRRLYERLLYHYHLQMEMAAGTYILAMTSVGDVQEGMDRLTAALREIDAGLGTVTGGREIRAGVSCAGPGRPAKAFTVYPSSGISKLIDEARENGRIENRVKSLPFRDSVGHIATEYAYLYPPGSPLLVPGERVSQEAADVLQWYWEMGFTIEGLRHQKHIEVWIYG